jgi:hypothetical protein
MRYLAEGLNVIALRGVRRGRSRPAARVVALAGILGLLATLLPGGVSPARAGHEENPRKKLREIGFHNMGGDGFNTDIWTWVGKNNGLYAASGTWGTVLAPPEDCPSETDPPTDSQSGIKILDASNPEKPEMVARMEGPPGSQTNDVKVMRLPTNEGKRDLLVHSLEPCGVEGLFHQLPGSPWTDFMDELFGTIDQAATGFRIYDVDDPENPQLLSQFTNDGLGTHNLYPFSRGDRSFVAAVHNKVDFLEVENDFITGRLQIVEITNPRDPQLIGEWQLEDAEAEGGPPEHDQVGEDGETVEERGLCQPRGTDSAFCYNHDVWVSDDSNIAYLSFWDAGLILLDLSDLTDPRFIGQAQEHTQPNDTKGWLNDEGNTHVAVPYQSGGRHLVMVGDEDFTGGAELGVQVNSPEPLEGFNRAVQWGATAEVDNQTADLVYAGTGCNETDYLGTNVAGKIVFVDDREPAPGWPGNPACPTYLFAQKVNHAFANGAIGFVQIPREGGEPRGNATAVHAEIPALEVFRNADTEAVRAAVIADSEKMNPGNDAPPVNASLTRGGEIDPWGFARIVDVTNLEDPASWTEVNQFKAPHVEDPNPGPEDVFSAHNPLVGPDGKLYFAWYTDGVRVLKPDDSTVGGYSEPAWFVPRPGDHPSPPECDLEAQPRNCDNDHDPHGVQEAHVGFWGSMAIRHPATGQLLVFNSDLNRGLYILGYKQPNKCPGLAKVRGNHVVGTDNADVLKGTPARDVICGLGSGDYIWGKKGNDLLLGHGGNDVIEGGGGKDLIKGSRGRDWVRGKAGHDRVKGGAGHDDVHGQMGKDRLWGGAGDDKLQANRGGWGDDILYGGSGDDLLRGLRDNDELYGQRGNDRLDGGRHKDKCRGGAGRDRKRNCER